MNLLLEPLPQSVWIDDTEYALNTDFRTSIQFELAMLDPELSDTEKAETALRLYYPNIPHDLEQATAALLAFYSGDRPEEEKRGSSKARRQKQIYSFAYDDEYIYAAFMDQYGMDLNAMDYLHWWTFKALFKALREDMMMVKIMGFRSAKIEEGMSKEQKGEIRKLHRLYDLPANRSQKQKDDAIAELLMNGGDIEAFLAENRD